MPNLDREARERRAAWLVSQAAEYRRSPFLYLMTHAAAPEIVEEMKRAGLVGDEEETRR